MGPKEEVIRLFCEPPSEEESRYDLQQPWNECGWTYATDARILIRFPAPDEKDSPPSKNKRPDVKDLFRTYWQDGAEFAPWPYPTAADVCPKCQGWESVTSSTRCGNCHGTGRAPCCECGQDTDCDECEDGKVGTFAMCDCFKESDPLTISDTGEIDPMYLRRISHLADVEWLPLPKKQMILFTFAGGGQGICMAKTPPNAR